MPPPDLRNKADKKLAKAQLWLDRYERNQVNRSANLWVYLGVTTPPVAAAIIALEAAMVGTSQYVFYQMLLLFGGAMVIESWIIGLLIVSALPDLKAKIAYSKIRNSPKKAPTERWIEYEVRTLLMLNNVMMPREQIARIKRIREISQSDLYNPWLSRLKELKYYDQSFKKYKRSIIPKDPLTLFLLLTLGLPLLVLLGSVISSFF